MSSSKLKEKLFLIVFTTDTKYAKLFDIFLIVAILLNALLVMLDSVGSIRRVFHREMYVAEWVLTLLFTVEYILRIYVVRRKLSYVTGFFGIIDFLSIIPVYIDLVFSGVESLTTLRMVRIFRIFRILKLINFVSETSLILQALQKSRYKIYIFLFCILNIAVIFGSFMYVIEGPENGFTSIPRSIYWAIVTMTTVGYGDISPHTVFGQMVTTIIILLGYGIIAVPTGFISAEMTKLTVKSPPDMNHICSRCKTIVHDKDAIYCKYCGYRLQTPASL